MLKCRFMEKCFPNTHCYQFKFIVIDIMYNLPNISLPSCLITFLCGQNVQQGLLPSCDHDHHHGGNQHDHYHELDSDHQNHHHNHVYNRDHNLH